MRVKDARGSKRKFLSECKTTEELRAALQALINHHGTAKSVARKYGVSPSSMTHLIKVTGIKRIQDRRARRAPHMTHFRLPIPYPHSEDESPQEKV